MIRFVALSTSALSFSLSSAILGLLSPTDVAYNYSRRCEPNSGIRVAAFHACMCVGLCVSVCSALTGGKRSIIPSSFEIPANVVRRLGRGVVRAVELRDSFLG